MGRSENALPHPTRADFGPPFSLRESVALQSVGADLGLPSRQERSSPLRGATKVAPYGFSQRDRSYAFAFFDASMRTSTSTAITMSTTPSASEIQGFFVKPAMM